VILVTALAVGGASVAGASTPTGSQREALRAAASGSYTSPYGTLQFGTAGPAHFSIRNCGVSETRPGFGEVSAECDATDYSGKLHVVAHGYDITQADRSTISIDAYIDDDGALHVGSGTIGTVTADRTGTVTMFAGDRLKIGTDTCTYVPGIKGRTVTAPCSYRTAKGRTVLVFQKPDTFHPKKNETRGLVLVPDARLLVDPGLVPLVYTRS
jgi:hypothetical protein